VREKESRQDDDGNGQPRNQKEFITRRAELILRWSFLVPLIIGVVVLVVMAFIAFTR
jgi:hypothetical protein